jgi:cobalamin biosynthesis Mg chelatase CobN
MSVSGISGSSLYQANSVQSGLQQRRATFQQLGQDLQSGNLSAAQQDYANLTQSASSATQSRTGVQKTVLPWLTQQFSALKQTLQSGNLAGAQQAYSAIQQNAQKVQQSQAYQQYRRFQLSSAGNQNLQAGSSSSSSSSSSGSSNNSSSNSTGVLSSLLNIVV